MKVTLVTGGGKRLGAAIVRRLAADGHGVVIHCHDSDVAANALAVEIAGVGGTAWVVNGDLADAAVAESLVETAALAANQPLTGLVNNAALFDYDSVEMLSPALLDRHFRVNCAAPLLLSTAFAKQAPDEADSAIVHMLDQKLENPNPDFMSYTVSKAALAGAIGPQAMAFAGRVRVNGVAPGILFPSFDQTEAEFAAVNAGNLAGRSIAVEDVANCVAFLLDNPAVTGEILHADNGQRFIASARDVMFSTRTQNGPT